VATSSCHGHVDELATEPFLLLHREDGTGGGAENAGLENAGVAKMQGWKTRDWKTRHQTAGWKTRDWKMQESEKYGKRRFQKFVSDCTD